MAHRTDKPIRVTGPGGECCRCRENVAERIMVGIVEVGSGPSRSRDACIPCARIFARSPFAPTWLREDLDAYDAQQEDAK